MAAPLIGLSPALWGLLKTLGPYALQTLALTGGLVGASELSDRVFGDPEAAEKEKSRRGRLERFAGRRAASHLSAEEGVRGEIDRLAGGLRVQPEEMDLLMSLIGMMGDGGDVDQIGGDSDAVAALLDAKGGPGFSTRVRMNSGGRPIYEMMGV